MKRRAALLFALCLGLAAPACRPAPKAGDERRTGDGRQVESVRYVLALDAPARAGGTPAESLLLTTNRGYRVSLKRALLSTYSATLVPCVAKPPEPRPARGAELLRELLLPRAHAGHNTQRDPSYLGDGMLEDLRKPGRRELGVRSFPAARYCRVHYLVAGASDGQRGLPAGDAALAGVTLLLEGSARAADGSETPLTVRTQLAHGRLSELSEILQTAPGEGGTLEITFRRSLNGLLDDVELGTATAQEIERAALRNLLDDTKIEARWL